MAKKITLLKRNLVPSGGTGFHVEQDLAVMLDSNRLALMVGEAVRQEAVEAINSGEHGEVDGRPRGLNTGRMRDSITVIPSGNGEVLVRSMAFDRQDFMAAEAERGVYYISAERASPQIKAAIAVWKASLLSSS
jgi:hypothetical protein